MLSVKPTKDLRIIKDIFFNPTLFQATNGHSNLPKERKVSKHSKWLLIRDDKNIIGCFELKKFTEELVEGHILILPRFWGKDLALSALRVGTTWCADNTKYKKIITHVPFVCEHVHRLLLHSGFIPYGAIKDGCVFNNIVNDLIFYSYDLKREA